MAPTANRRYWKWLVIGLALAGTAIASFFVPLEDWVNAFVLWSEQRGYAGMAIFAAVYTVSMVACVWGTPFTIAAGVAFGVWWGTAVATFSATAGSAIAFLIARYLARDVIERWVQRNEKYNAIDHAIGEFGWRIVFLTRFSPIIPFSFSNYMFGLTKVRFWPFVWASLAAILPGSFLVAYLGHAGRLAFLEGRTEPGAWQYLLMGGAVVFTAGIIYYFTRLARRTLARTAGDREGEVKSEVRKTKDEGNPKGEG